VGRRRWTLLFQRKHEIYHNGRMAFEDSHCLRLTGDAMEAGTQFIISVGTESAEMELAISLHDVGANLEALQLLEEDDGSGHGVSGRIENRSLNRAGNGRRTMLLAGGSGEWKNSANQQ